MAVNSGPKKPKIRRRKIEIGLTDTSQKPITNYFPTVNETIGCQNGKRKLEIISKECPTENKKPRVGKLV